MVGHQISITFDSRSARPRIISGRSGKNRSSLIEFVVKGGGGGEAEEGGIAVGSGTRAGPPAAPPSVSAGAAAAASDSTPEAALERDDEAAPPSGEGARCAAASPTRDLRSGGVPGRTPLRLDGEDLPPAALACWGSPLSSEVRNMSGGTSSSATIRRSISDLMP